MTADRFAKLLRARPAGPGKWTAQCPAHQDDKPSLSISEGKDGRVLVHCFAGCAPEDVVETAGVDWSEMFAGPRWSTRKLPATARREVARRNNTLRGTEQ